MQARERPVSTPRRPRRAQPSEPSKATRAGEPPWSTSVHRVARASDKRLQAVGSTHGMDTRDSHLPRAFKLDAFLAMQCLGDKILAAVKSSVTFIKTRWT